MIMDVEATEDTLERNVFTTIINNETQLQMEMQPFTDNTNNPSEYKTRAKWGHSMEFLMSCIAMSVGLGNLWRFPFTAYENGGGAFLIPYLITLVVIGRPMYLLDMFLGQFSSKANVHVFNSLTPGFVGIAFGQIYAVSNIATYYCSVMALSLSYVVSSFSKVLPWSVCEEEWDNCVDTTSTINSTQNSTISSPELFLKKTILHEKDDIELSIGSPDPYLTLYLFIAWLFIFLVVIKGVKSSGKASYFLALFPYVVLLTLFIKGLTLKGAIDGIKYFLKPDWSKMLEPKVWFAAVTQCFFSLNVAVGPVVMYSSYNDFRHDIKRDSLIVSLMDTITSLLAGITIFAILGNLADNLQLPLEQVVKPGPGLAFVSYPKAIANFASAPQVFAVLFFLMLFVLGTGSIVSMQGCVATVLKDQYPQLKNWWIATGSCLIGFLIGLVYVTPGGQYILTLVDHYAAISIVYVMAIAEVVVVTWFYGLEDMCLDLEFMLKKKINIYWRLCWGIVTPGLLLTIFIYYFASLETVTHGGKYYPTSLTAIGWILFIFGVAQIPVWALINVFKRRKLGWEEAISKTFSFENWGPKEPNKRKEWEEFKRNAKMYREATTSSRIMYLINTLTNRNELI